MHDATDMELLGDYNRQGSDDAFAVVVQRHINLVYSVALRHVGIAAQAEEITQAVFVILARKSARLRPNTILEGWLHETARLTALSFKRGELRRQLREQEAYMQSTLQDSTDTIAWNQLAPLLDEAMSHLGKKDRDAVILRFFNGRSLREVAVALSVKESAAQRRVHRALEKLRRFYTRRGVVLGVGALTVALSAHSVQAAPVALAKSVTAVAAAKGAAAGGSTVTLIKGTLKLMAWTKAKTALTIGVAAILAVGITPIAVHYHPSLLNVILFSRTHVLSSDEDSQYAGLTGMTPKQAATLFFEACGRSDWTEAAKFWGGPETQNPINDNIKNYLGGISVVSLGQPFWGWPRTGGRKTYVPYEIRFKDGSVKKFQLALRCDNPDKHWYVDGGL